MLVLSGVAGTGMLAAITLNCAPAKDEPRQE